MGEEIEGEEMSEMWIEKPELPLRCKVRIFKSRKDTPFPWYLVLPATPTLESKRRAIPYPDWKTPWMIAGAIQDKKNRNEPTP